MKLILLLALLSMANAQAAIPGELTGSWSLDSDELSAEMALWPRRDPDGKEISRGYTGFIYFPKYNCLGLVSANLGPDNENLLNVSFNVRTSNVRENNCTIKQGQEILNIGVLFGPRGRGGDFVLASDKNSFRHKQINLMLTNKNLRSKIVDGWQDRRPMGFSRSSLSPDMKDLIETVYLQFITLPIASDFDGINIPSLEERQTKTIFAHYSGSKYLEAMFNGNLPVLKSYDKKFSALYVSGAGSKETRGYRDFSRLWNGQGMSNDEQDHATVSWLDNMSLVAPMMITYLFNFDSIYKRCLGPSPQTVSFTTEWIETTYDYNGFPSSTESLGTTETSYTVKQEYYDILRAIALSDPLISAEIDNYFQQLSKDKQRIPISSIIEGTQQYMRNTACTSEAAQKMESQLVATYKKYMDEQEVFVNKAK